MELDDKKVLSELCKDWAETGIIVDFLEDANATIGDVLSLYAGRPPHWVDGLYKPILDEFLLRKDDSERARKVASIDDGSPRSLVPRMRMVSDTSRAFGEGRSILYPIAWREQLEFVSTSASKQKLHCPGCSRTGVFAVSAASIVAIAPMPKWWPLMARKWEDGCTIGVAAFCCPDCSNLLLCFNPSDWWPVRQRKCEVVNLFHEVTVPCLKQCSCNSNDMMFTPCRTCNGNGWYYDGKVKADHLIPRSEAMI